jgi:HlyD family secretion protein
MNRRKALLIGVAAIVVVTTVALVARGIRRAPPLDIAYGVVTVGPIVREVMTTGTLEPARAVETGAQVSGTVQALFADFNTPVRAGEVIARLDPSAYDSAVNQAQAKLIQAEADAHGATLVARDAGVKKSRAESLAGQSLITQAELDAAVVAAQQADAAAASANAAVDLARAALKQAQVTRDRTVIRSPIDGVVVNRSVEVGQTLASSFESPVLFTIADLRQMRLLAEINEADVGSVKAGTPVSFEVESMAGRRFAGKVAEVRLQPVVDQASSSPSGSTSPAAPAAAGSPSPGATPSPAAPSSSRAVGTTGTAASAQAAQPTNAQVPAAPAGAVVNYTAVIDVDNPRGELTPGSTAILTLPAAQRASAVRVPNRALAFRPSPDAFEALRQQAPDLATGASQGAAMTGAAQGRSAYVWKFADGRFVPIAVQVGLADESWTELIEGALQPGDQLVTSAEHTRPR